MDVPQKKRLIDDLSMSTPNRDEMDQIIDNLNSNDFTALNDILDTDPNLSVNAIQYNKDAPITDPRGLAAGLHIVVPGYDKRLSVEETARKEVESQVTVAQKADDALVSHIPNLAELLKPGPFDSTPLDKVGEKKKTDIKLMQVSPLVRYGVRIKVARAGGESKRQFYTKIQSLSEYNTEIAAGTNQPIFHETQDAYIERMVTVLKSENDRLEAAFIAKEYPLKSFLVRFVWALGGKLGKDPKTPVPVEGHPMEVNPVAAARRVMSWMGGSTELVGVPVNSMTGAKFSRPEDWEGDQAAFEKSKQLVETAIFPLLTNIYRALYHSHLLGHSPAFISPGKPAGWNSLYIERNPPATTISEVAAAEEEKKEEGKKEEEKVPEKEKKAKKEKKTDEEKATEKQAKKEQKKQEKKTKKEQDRLEELLLSPSVRQERVNALLLEYIQALATKEKFRLDGKEQDESGNGGVAEDNEEEQPVVPASEQSAAPETVKSPIVPLKRISKEIARQCWMVMRPLLRRIVETGKDSLTLEEVPQVFEMFCGLFLDEFVDPLVEYLTDAFKHKPEESAVAIPDDEYHSAADEESTRIWAALHDANVELYFYDVVIAVLRSAKNLTRYFPGGLQGIMVNAEQVEIFFSFITENPDPKSTKSKETRVELLRAFERLQASQDAALSNLNTRFAEVTDVNLGELVGGDDEESEIGGGGGGEDDESLDSSSSSSKEKSKKKKVREGTVELTDEQAKDREFEIRVAQARRVEEARKILATGPSKEQKAGEDREDTQKSRDAVAKLNPEELKTELARLDKLFNRNAAPGSPGYKKLTMFDLEKFWKERFQLEREEKRHEEADDGYTIYERSTAQGLVDLDEENHQKALKNGDIETIKLRDRARLKALEELAEEEQDESSESHSEESKEHSPKLPTPPKNKSAPSPKPMVISPSKSKPVSQVPVIVHNPPQKKRIVPMFLGTQAPPEPQKKKRIIEDEEEQVESKVARKTKGDSFGEPIMVPPVVLTPSSVAQSPLQSENSNSSTTNVIYEKQTPLPLDASVTEETPKYEELKDDEINPHPVPTQSSRNDTLQQVNEKGIERVLLEKILSIISLADFLIAWASKDVKKLYVIYEQRDKGAELLLKAARSEESGLGSKILFNDQSWRFYYAKTFFWSRTDVKWAEQAGVFASRVLFQSTWQRQFMNYYASLMSHVLFQETKGIQSIQSGVCWPSGVNGTLTIGVAHFWDGSKHNVSFMCNITKEHFAKCFGGRAIVEVSVKRGDSTVKSMLDYDANSNDYVASYPYLDEDTQDPQRTGLKPGIHIKIVVGSDSDNSTITVHGAGDKDATLPSKMSLGMMLYADSSLLKLKGAAPVFDIMQMYHLITPSNILVKKDNKESPIYYPYSTDHPVRNISTDRYAGVAFKVRVSDAGVIDVAQEITVTLPRDPQTLQNIVVVQNNSQLSKEAKQHPVSEKPLEPTLIVIHLECYDILHKLFWAPEISYHNSKSLSRRLPTPDDLLHFRSLILKDSGSGKTLQELRVVHEQKKLTCIALPLAVTFGHTDDSRNRDMLVSMDLLNGSIQSVTNVAMLKENSAVSMIESRMRKIKVTSPVNGATMSVPKHCASCKSQITSFSTAYSIPSDCGEAIHFACGKSCASAIVVQSRRTHDNKK